jgi:hypothetical protein
MSLPSHNLRYSRVIGWFCRVPRGYEFNPKIPRDEQQRIVGTKGGAAGKSGIPQAAVEYRPAPNGLQRCGACEFFNAEAGHCKKVAGVVGPNGWCDLFKEA